MVAVAGVGEALSAATMMRILAIERVEISIVSVTTEERGEHTYRTGLSKLFRFRDLLNQSNSDGRYAFIFLNGSATTTVQRERRRWRRERKSTSEKKISGEVRAVKVRAKKGGKGEKASFSDHYSRDTALREGGITLISLVYYHFQLLIPPPCLHILPAE
ncbi:hypothetical protein Vadar_014359 [Vaccinium darrowii]|uniref:Uncharacterized protein n=1 Tax=Vaccinium darrowii TaxID=229202 RepID=A0ACB7YVS8_9ERIC|nr:hypothetical protein Vadar_014359 [Vaccinium darrowii]